MNVKSLILLLVLICTLPAHGQHQKDRPTSYEDDLTFIWQQQLDSIRLLAKSKIHAPIEVLVFDRATDEALQSILLEKFDSVEIRQFAGQNIDSLKNYLGKTFRIAYFLGHPDRTVPDTNYLYRLPFRKGKKYEVSQGWNGKSSHNSDRSRFALDFQLNVGEPVFAARDGIVIKAIDWFTKQGGPELRDAANRIVILHDDGTMANYVHLKYRGVLVAEGEQVSRGQKIGISGLTGFTRGPHLHFVVRKERDISIPVYFEGYEGRALKRGRRYRVKE